LTSPEGTFYRSPSGQSVSLHVRTQKRNKKKAQAIKNAETGWILNV